MSKKSLVKTTEQLTEEFFAAERAGYEKRVAHAFPRVEVRKLTELGELAESADLAESSELTGPDIEGGKSKEKG
jgi:hypothetical protein